MKRKLFIFRAQEQSRERLNRKSVNLSSPSSAASPPTNTESKRGHTNTRARAHGYVDFQMQPQSQSQAHSLQVTSRPFSGAASDRGVANFAAPGPGTGGVAMSRQSSQGWMPASMHLAEATAAKSSSHRNGSPFTLTQDGIHKENARFEIPAELTLSRIDQLISQATSEKEVKDLKQQKRLLRNRQAALDSRRRKKLHTEELEKKEIHYMHVISQLEDAIVSLQKREAEMIREHTLGTAELRKKNNILLEAIEKLEQGSKPPIVDQD
ncbi:hypothetical protein N7493_006013 [Penicillium malachiteum]|uniref:BZIP domain-containing protein n=1 Tax=Penicillium malachiteum TaxID=1324776 RepID=A0AAD6MVY6_9EURO|nr:hypothetical protein N7493_006013 [Penicillium malachiteum]